MNDTKTDYRRKDLARIHIAKKKLGWEGKNDETYRDVLVKLTGKSSSADMDVRERWLVINHLNALIKGTLPKKKGYPGKPKDFDNPLKNPRYRKIEAFLAEARRHWNYAHNTGKKILGFDRLEWATHEELGSIIAALTKDAKRNGRRTG